MRTAAVCIKGLKKISNQKRKHSDNSNDNEKTSVFENDDNDKENFYINNSSDTLNNNPRKRKNGKNFEALNKPQCHDSVQRGVGTHEFIVRILNSIKSSAKKILPRSITNKSWMIGFKTSDCNSPSKEENIHNSASLESCDSGKELKCNEALKLCSFQLSLPVNENMCLIKVEEDPMISLFIKRDVCRLYADKYLLAMVLIYFTRAHLTPCDFSRENFFAALYLAHDMEEDLEELKYELFPFCLGTKWKKYYSYLLSVRDDLFWALDCRAVVSRKCCEQVMELIPNHWIWERERPDYHANVYRTDSVLKEFCQPRGPFKSPLWCRSCLERECMDSENSYIVYTSASDSSSHESQDDTLEENPAKDSGFESFLCLSANNDENNNVENGESP